MERGTSVFGCRRGATAIEYALIAALVALAVLGLSGAGDALSGVFVQLAGNL